MAVKRALIAVADSFDIKFTSVAPHRHSDNFAAFSNFNYSSRFFVFGSAEFLTTIVSIFSDLFLFTELRITVPIYTFITVSHNESFQYRRLKK